ncbi:hypothetical protein AB0K82_34700, partial [Actinoallomurus sp. NPDC052274]
MTRAETSADLIAAEDVLLFVNAAITSTGQREFHSGDAEQRLSLDFLHQYLLGNYRDLYAAALALDVNDHNAVLIARTGRDRSRRTARRGGRARSRGRTTARRTGRRPL